MSDFNKIARDYISLWNETDTARRARLLGEQWTPRATYIDPLAKAAGHDEIGPISAVSTSASPAIASPSWARLKATANTCASPGAWARMGRRPPSRGATS